jgi:hypothetical protein
MEKQKVGTSVWSRDISNGAQGAAALSINGLSSF